MTFDLMAYARQRRYRVRNLHDGHEVPPARPPKHGERGPVPGYVGASDRMDAVIGRNGYICDAGNGQLGWYLEAGTKRRLSAKLQRLAELGIEPHQLGDAEAAGEVGREMFSSLATVLQLYRCPQGSNGGSQAPEGTQAAGKVVKVGAGAESAVERAVVGRS